ncbi:hypothetical protein BDV27DRAFT_120938 [Aspergillus caelatus]|uniref:Uncharacterized protein n=1 Tax=Aspergillus caelatus TaxID=61420 RepID=A0A5N7AK31_9EURO|nr:uncharacterized protein BDV27DRAFT_120938 [Aspergillus caelatus]KAE8369418.1 hypothetical protein BDV27DRAFT_120938 [Aspergillus caelatus]
MDISITSAPVIYYTKRSKSHYKKWKKEKGKKMKTLSLNFSSFNLVQSQFPFIIYIPFLVTFYGSMHGY